MEPRLALHLQESYSPASTSRSVKTTKLKKENLEGNRQHLVSSRRQRQTKMTDFLKAPSIPQVSQIHPALNLPSVCSVC